jgi:hypothetical protein
LRSKFQYNNIMFMVTGHLIETIDGRPWEEAVRARIFQPLGMGSSNFSVRDSQKSDDHATPYAEHEGKVRAIPFRDITNVGAAGSINSNVTEMSRWMAVHTQGGKLGGKSIISPSVLAELHTPQMTMGRPSQKKGISPAFYALGWMVDTYRGHRSVGHGGGIDGFTSETSLFPDDGMGIVVLTNKEGSPLPDLIVHHAADRLLGLEPIDWLAEGLDQNKKREDARKEEAKKKKETWRRYGTHPAHPLEEYSGEYEHPAYGPLRIELRDPTLDHLDWKFQFQTNLKGYVDAVAMPLYSNIKPIVFTKRPDKKLSDPEYLKRFAGEYEHSGQALTIRLQGHVLMFEQKGQRPLELVPDRDDGFNLKQDTHLSLRFVSNPQGKVVELALNSLDGGSSSAKRKP